MRLPGRIDPAPSSFNQSASSRKASSIPSRAATRDARQQADFFVVAQRVGAHSEAPRHFADAIGCHDGAPLNSTYGL